MFSAFLKHLREHPARGYHRSFGPIRKEVLATWFAEAGWTPNPEYISFLSEIGPGIYFGGSLVIFPLEHGLGRTVRSETEKLSQMGAEKYMAFGYDGTTEGAFALDKTFETPSVLWFSYPEKHASSLAASFGDWAAQQPAALFSKAVYGGYKTIRDLDPLMAVMDERSAFQVRLLTFSKEMVRPPDRGSDLLPRYNKGIVEISKTRQVDLSILTLKVLRVGSKVGKDNLEYVSIPVGDVSVGVPVQKEFYVFDPFNLPFDDLRIDFNPIIDLGSKMRVKFKEIKALL
jgi:hypothetical protein